MNLSPVGATLFMNWDVIFLKGRMRYPDTPDTPDTACTGQVRVRDRCVYGTGACTGQVRVRDRLGHFVVIWWSLGHLLPLGHFGECGFNPNPDLIYHFNPN